MGGTVQAPKYIVNATDEMETLFWRLAPPVAGVLLVILFVSLGFWQLDRAAEKNAQRRLFDAQAPYTALDAGMEVQDYQRISASGRFLGDRQFLVDNMIMNSRVGYYVITPFEYAAGGPLLMVNRGWIPAMPDRSLPPLAPLSGAGTEILGRAGRLPRVGIRSGNAIDSSTGWPKLATYPELPDLARELGRDVLPFVLLLDPQHGEGFVRDWQPKDSGPAMHYGYAFQWFAMAAAVLGLLAWQLLRKRGDRASA